MQDLLTKMLIVTIVLTPFLTSERTSKEGKGALIHLWNHPICSRNFMNSHKGSKMWLVGVVLGIPAGYR